MNTTPGEWIVVPATEACLEGTYLHQVVAVTPDGNQLVALVPNAADAAAIAAMPITLDALIQVAALLNSSKDLIRVDRLNKIISVPFEKIAAESGEI